MSSNVGEVERALLALSPRERAEVIHHGLLSLEGDDADAAVQAEVDAEWRAEFRRRIEGIENGEVNLVSGEESEARVRALLHELRG